MAGGCSSVWCLVRRTLFFCSPELACASLSKCDPPNFLRFCPHSTARVRLEAPRGIRVQLSGSVFFSNTKASHSEYAQIGARLRQQIASATENVSRGSRGCHGALGENAAVFVRVAAENEARPLLSQETLSRLCRRARKAAQGHKKACDCQQSARRNFQLLTGARRGETRGAFSSPGFARPAP